MPQSSYTELGRKFDPEKEPEPFLPLEDPFDDHVVQQRVGEWIARCASRKAASAS
jgi:hypothetical protein